MTIVRIDHAYHGAGFAGWAAQPGLRTVEAELESAIQEMLGDSARLTVAGRTDAGVHAWGQVASTELAGEPPEGFGRALHALTGHDLAVISAAVAPDGFDARADARSRTYCYRLLTAPVEDPFERGLALFWPYRLDTEALERCADALRGRHDFTAFTPTDTKHQRFEREIIHAGWEAEPGERDQRPGEVLRFWIESPSFMHGMVRTLVGTMLEVAKGKRTIEDFERLLEGAPRQEAGDTARAEGLYLASVRY